MARILVIDDETNIRRMMRLALLHSGHTVETAEDGTDGLKKFGDGADWDIVLLDQRMPDIQGVEVLRQIRARDDNARVIVVTAFGTIDLAVEAMKAGASDFLRKPFTAQMLRGAVDSALAEKAASPSPRSQVTFGMMTMNGCRIEFQPNTGTTKDGGWSFPFSVRTPEGEKRSVTVTLPPYLVELVKAQTDRETFPGGARFWQSLAEETLANYLYQHAETPPEGRLAAEELTTSLRRFVETILTAGAEEQA